MGSSPSQIPEYPIVVVVVGATYSEGATVVKALRTDARFTVKAVTDDISTDKAKAMIESGVDMVEADFNDRESLQSVIDGAYGVFATTDFWAHLDEERDSIQGLLIADACIRCKVSHVVWSGMEDEEAVIFRIKNLTGGYMDAMGKAIDVKVTMVILAYHYENLLGLMKPKKVNDKYVLEIPMQGKVLPMISVEDSGECIRQIFIDKKKFAKKTVGLVGHWATVDSYARMMTDILDGMTFTATKMTAEEFGKKDMPEAPFLGPMFSTFQSDYLYPRNSKIAKKLNPALMDFPTWVRSKKEEFAALANVVEPITE